MEKDNYPLGLLFAPKIKNLMKIMEDLFLMKIRVLDQKNIIYTLMMIVLMNTGTTQKFCPTALER